MFLSLKSPNNKNFSWIINKNPDSFKDVPFIKKLKQGQVIGSFNNNNDEFDILFVDHPDKTSYISIHQEYEYLDKTRYGSPYAGMDILKSVFNNNLSKDNELDTLPASLNFPLKISSEYAFDGFINQLNTLKNVNFLYSIFYESKHFKYVDFTIKTNSISETLSLSYVLLFLMSLYDRDFYYTPQSQMLEKVFKVLNKNNINYYIRHLICNSGIQNLNTFNELKSLINTDSIKIIYGTNQEKRFSNIFAELDLKDEDKVIDIGCGEGYYVSRLAPLVKEYHSFDFDKEAIYQLKKVLVRKNINNHFLNETFLNKDNFKEYESIFKNSKVILTEVVEHMPLKEAKDLINCILNSGVKQLVITTPNKDFNSNYFINGFRHDDHYFEMSFNEWVSFINKLNISGYYVDHKQIGDVVHTETSTTLTNFTKH